MFWGLFYSWNEQLLDWPAESIVVLLERLIKRGPLYWLRYRSRLPQWTAVGQPGRSGRCVTVAVGGASRNEPAAALTPPPSTEDCRVMDRPFRNWPAPHCAPVSGSPSVCIHIYGNCVNVLYFTVLYPFLLWTILLVWSQSVLSWTSTALHLFFFFSSYMFPPYISCSS